VLTENELLSFVEKMYGANGRKIIEALMKSKTGMGIDEIAHETKLRTNDIRKLLYEMAKEGFVITLRSQRGESIWYTYRWYTDIGIIKRALVRRLKTVLNILNERLEYEQTNTFYICPTDYTIYSFEEAFENGFRCIHCQSELVAFDNKTIITYLKNLIEELERVLKAISSNEA
jgi:transcription initiation factor TFIIE subunit alpha